MNKSIIYFGEKTIPSSDDIAFIELKKLILGKEKRLILYFSYKNMKINESYLVREYPEFLYEMDPNIFNEFSKEKFRCQNCRKYLKMETLKCAHTESCKALYKFKKIDFIKTNEGKYVEDDMTAINRILDKQSKKSRELHEKKKRND